MFELGHSGWRGAAAGLLLGAFTSLGQPRVSDPLVFTGMCDASGVAAVGSNWVAVADDEGNQLRLYRADAGGPPTATLELGDLLGLGGKFPEADLEGAAWLETNIFWIGSHGRNRDGKYRANRQCFFATSVAGTAESPRLVLAGTCYKELLTDMLVDSRLRALGLPAASGLAPKAKGGLNIEGLCATPDGRLLIGFRNPLPKKKALLLPLLNPREVITGQLARFGDPILLDLGGLGIRDLGFWQGRYYILAGPYDQEKTFRLLVWEGGADKPRQIKPLNFRHLTPEALAFFPNRPDFLVLSDDGTRLIGGTPCKLEPDPARKKFHGVWVTP